MKRAAAIVLLAVFCTISFAQVEPSGPKYLEHMSTISRKEVDSWIQYFTARYHEETVPLPDTSLPLSAIYSYFPFTGLHEIYPEGSEQLYGMQVFVFSEGKKLRYSFSFAAAKPCDPKVADIRSFFGSLKVTKYYICRVDDGSNTNPIEPIIKNGRTDKFDIHFK